MTSNAYYVTRLSAVAVTILLPGIVLAQTQGTTLIDVIGGANSIVTRLFPLMVSVALAVFLFGVVKFIWSAGNAQAREVGKKFLFWGVVALFLMVSVWGIVAVLASLFGTGVGGGENPPQVDVSQ